MTFESTANMELVEVDEVVEKEDSTGGRGINGEIGRKLEIKDVSEEEVLQSAV